MGPGRFFWKLFWGHAALLVLTLGLCVWLIVAEFDRFHAGELTPYLHNYAETIRVLAEDRLKGGGGESLDVMVKGIAESEPGAVRVTVMAPDGRVLADSQADPSTMDNHRDRPEVRGALGTGRGESTRPSDTVHRMLKYVALRVGTGGNPAGVVRVAMPVRSLAERTWSVRRLLGPLGLVAVLAALALAVGLALVWSSRIRRLTSAAQSLSRGDLSTAVPVAGHDEVALLARALERMRARLSGQLSTINRQRRTWETLIHELGEGIVVADDGGRIVLANPAAKKLLNCPLPAQGLEGQSPCRVEECITHHDLQRMLLGKPTPESHSGETSGPEDVESWNAEGFDQSAIRLESPGGAPSHVLARVREISISVPLDDRNAGTVEKNLSGRLLVLTDVTELVRAMRARSDFVGNASHELRTPVAAIRVAVETLLRMTLPTESEAAARFLRVIERHAARLEALVGDLLALARVESPGARFKPTTLHLQRVVDELRGRWEEELAKKQIEWHAEVEHEASSVAANAHLLALALDNLMDNAIKFTPQGGKISIRCRRVGDRTVLEIRDSGCGIPAEDQDRVFERFYQVTASRTGTGSPAMEQRGTGLGLSIVRHAVAAMGGTVRLESELGKGTTVAIALPPGGKND